MKARIGKTVDQLEVGESAYFAKTMTNTDMLMFAGVTGDVNLLPIHDEFAKKSIFKQRIAHGMLTASFITNIIGMRLPGYGSTVKRQSVRFTNPVFIGDTIEIGLTITATDIENNTADFTVNATNQDGKEIMVGNGVLIPPTPIDEEE
ncbi:MAG: MaoC family dehydratase [Gammaproteobacteria bacterium]|nr:MAG: MaoC family dehydratase [Gammaproteobacteria bacterium]